MTDPPIKAGPVRHPTPPALDTLTIFEQALAALNPQRQSFVRHYLAHGVAIAAARESGFESKNTRLLASRIRSDPHVAHAIALGRKEVVANIAQDAKMGAEAYVAQIEEKVLKAEAEGPVQCSGFTTGTEG